MKVIFAQFRYRNGPVINILHVGTDPLWRGGENQIKVLGLGLKPMGVTTYIAYPQTSLAVDRFREHFEVTPLPGPFRASCHRLIETIDKNDIQIVNAHSSAAHKLALAIKGKTKKPIRLVVHRRVGDFPKWNIFRKAKYLNSKIDAFVAVSKFIATILEANGIDKSRISLIHDCVNPTDYQNVDRKTARLDWAKKLNIGSEPTLIGIVAALTREKGHKTLLQAAARLKGEANFKLIVAGGGPLESELKTLCTSLGLDGSVFFLGPVANVPHLLTALDIVVLPSSAEGFGSILLDATLAGCSLIASNVGGIPEFVHPNQTGDLFQPTDAESLAQYLKNQITDTHLRLKYQKSALALVQAEFSVETTCAKTLALYNRLLSLEASR